ncbi:MAG: GatB/YqeY domain-containing protein [Gammaproteobacteria bacterium]
MSLKERIQDDMKAAMRAGDKARLGVVRMALAALQQREIDDRTTLDEPEATAVIEKLVKQRRESVTQFEQAGRDELAAKERAEIEVLQEYLPEQLSSGEVDDVIEAAIAATGASSMRDMGKVMAEVKQKAQGRADMAAVSARVKARLAS